MVFSWRHLLILIIHTFYDDKSNLIDWLIYLLIYLNSVPVVLVGNKTDLHQERAVSYEEGKKLAESWRATFLETSAKQNEVNLAKCHPFVLNYWYFLLSLCLNANAFFSFNFVYTVCCRYFPFDSVAGGTREWKYPGKKSLLHFLNISLFHLHFSLSLSLLHQPNCCQHPHKHTG